MNRLKDDQCFQQDQYKRSVTPFDMIMQPWRNEHVNPCRDDSPLGGRAIPHQQFSSLVDVESDLLGIRLTGGRCNARTNQYVPKCSSLPSGNSKCGQKLSNPGVKPAMQRMCPAAPVFPSSMAARYRVGGAQGPAPVAAAASALRY